MASTTCSECDEEVEISGRTRLGQKVACPHCGAHLEVIATAPLEVELSQEGDDPWEEDDLDDEFDEDLEDDDIIIAAEDLEDDELDEDLEDDLDDEEDDFDDLDDLEDDLEDDDDFDDDDFEDDDFDDDDNRW